MKCWPLGSCTPEEISALNCEEAIALAKRVFPKNEICEGDIDLQNVGQIDALIKRLQSCNVSVKYDQRACLVIDYGNAP